MPIVKTETEHLLRNDLSRKRQFPFYKQEPYPYNRKPRGLSRMTPDNHSPLRNEPTDPKGLGENDR